MSVLWRRARAPARDGGGSVCPGVCAGEGARSGPGSAVIGAILPCLGPPDLRRAEGQSLGPAGWWLRFLNENQGDQRFSVGELLLCPWCFCFKPLFLWSRNRSVKGGAEMEGLLFLSKACSWGEEL